MNHVHIRKIVTAIIFIASIMIFSIINLVYALPNIKKSANHSEDANINTTEKNIESSMEDSFLGKYSFVEGFGMYQKLIGKHEYNNFKYVKDKDDFFYYADTIEYENEWYLNNIADAIKNLSDKHRDIKFLVATPPDRMYDGKINGYTGINYTNSTENIDKYYKCLKKYGIDTLDYRNAFINSSYTKEELYYKSDHHWTTKGAFLAFQTMVNKLNNDGQKLDQYYTDMNNYHSINYKERFLGSYGRNMGYFYTGIDDYELLLPKFNTNYSFEKHKENGDIQKVNGAFEDTLTNKVLLSSDSKLYEQDVYSTYCDGVLYPLGKITNKLSNGPKILLIRDSYSSSFAAFLSTVCSEVDLLYPYYDIDIDKVISENNYDYVIFSGYCGTLGNELYDKFIEQYGTK